MTAPLEVGAAGHARCTYRLRVSSTALTALLGEWDRCRCLAGPSLNYNRNGFRLKDGRLHLAGGIGVTVVWSRDLPADPSSVRVHRDSLGHWYASFVVATEVQPLPETGNVLGIDWGVKRTATTTSDTHDFPHVEHGRKAAAKLTRYQQEGRPAASGHRPKMGQAGRPRS
jgi:putative transposase